MFKKGVSLTAKGKAESFQPDGPCFLQTVTLMCPQPLSAHLLWLMQHLTPPVAVLGRRTPLHSGFSQS